MLVLFYITRLASNEIHREVGRAKDLSAPRYLPNSCVPEAPALVGTAYAYDKLHRA